MFDYNPYKKDTRKELLASIPDVKHLPIIKGAVLFGGIALIGLGIGAAIGTYVFFGVITLAGLIAIAESNKYVRYVIVNSSYVIDMAIFVATIYATATLGVTVAASLTVAGLGYSLAYAPWLRQRALKPKTI